MIEIVLYILIFIMGAYFGSFYTLAIYRIPLGLNITHEHSFCPNCNHKLGILDLFPVFSYIFLGGKCRYCKKKIKPRYCILEILSGLTFLLFAISLNIDIYNLEIEKVLLLAFSYLYFAGIFIIVIYILYLYLVQNIKIYTYIVYLIMMLILVVLETLKIRKKGTESYLINILILAMCMSIFTGQDVFLLTAIYTLLASIIYMLIKKIKRNKKKFLKIENKPNTKFPVAFFMVTCNVIMYVICNFMVNYIIMK